MFEKVFAAFPKRPMRVRKHGVGHPVIGLIFIPLGFLFIWMVLQNDLPGIERDWEIARDPVAAPDVSVSNGKCRTSRAFFVNCSVTLGYNETINPATGKDPLARTRGNRRIEQKLEFSFVDFHNGDYTVDTVAARSNPRLVSVDLAVDNIWNRIITAAAIACLGVFMIGFGLWAMARLMNQRRIFRGFSGKVLHPFPVEITGTDKKSVSYRYEAKGKKRKFSTFTFRHKPFLLDGNSEPAMALAVVDEHGDYALLMDEELTRLDFTDDERQALWDARAGNAKSAPETGYPAARAGIEPAH